jgi:hypothetical protein
MGVQDEGTITFWLRHQHADWATNGHRYDLGRTYRSGVFVEAVKQPDRTIELSVSGPLGETFDMRSPIPPCDARGLFVAITWQGTKADLYLNGEHAQTVTWPPHDTLRA